MSPYRALGWTLVHSTWEVLSVAVLLSVALLCLRKASPNLRYGVAVLGMLGCLAAPLVTFGILSQGSVPAGIRTSEGAGGVALSVATVTRPPTVAAPEFASPPPAKATVIEPFLPYLVGLWLAGLAMMSLRLVGGLVAIERLKRRGTVLADEMWQAAAQTLAKRMGISRAVIIKAGREIEVPAVAGLFRIAILIPASMVSRLSPSQVKAILAHELAHVRRLDYLTNLLQSFVESVLFYHPAVWWISSVVRVEREHCCDDLAIQVLGNRLEYARALVSVEELRPRAPMLALRADGGRLLDRIRRIHTGDRPKASPSALGLALLLILGITFGVFRTLHAQSPPAGKKTTHLTGRILTEDGKPAAGAIVSALAAPSETMEPKAVQTVTDRDGQFSLASERALSHLISAYLPGQGLGAQYSNFGKPVEISLRHSNPLRLRLLDSAGKPVAHTAVRPYWINCDRVSIRDTELLQRLAAKTDQDGRVTLRDLPARGYMLIETEDPDFARGPAITLPGPSGILEKRLSPACEIRGIVSRNGEPVRGGWVNARSLEGGTEVAQTDGNGKFTVRRFPPGKVALSAFAESKPGEDWIASPIAVDLSPGRISRADIRFQRGARIDGQVVEQSGKPIAGELVYLLPQKVAPENPGTGFRLDGQGMFHHVVAPGTYRLVLRGHGGTEQPLALLAVNGGENRRIKATAKAEGPLISTTCQVLDEHGRPVGGIFVEYSYPHPTLPTRIATGMETDENGMATVFLPKQQAASLQFRVREGNRFSEPDVRPVNGKAVLRLRPFALASISGKVVDGQGNPVPEAIVSIGFPGRVSFVGNLEQMGPWEMRAGRDGSYRWSGLFPGIQVMVMARKPGFADAQAVPTRVSGGRDNAMPVLNLLPGGALEGQVVDSSGKPVAKARIFVDGVPRVKDIISVTDASGRFRIERLPKRDVRISVFKGYKEVHLTVRPGTPVRVKMSL